ncbi:hypothetical protein GCM10009127_18580 [Alteraurantiacibacter aestuarii]
MLTAALAMFANGENKELEDQEVQTTQPAAQPAQPSRETAPASAPAAPDSGQPAYGEARLRTRTIVNGTFDDSRYQEFDSTYGKPTGMRSGTGTNSAYDPYAQTASYGYSKAYLDSLSPEERELLMEQMRAASDVSPEERERQAASLTAASRRRSGTATTYD